MDETPQEYVRRFTLWSIETYGETCTGNVIVSIDSCADEWGLEIGAWYGVVHLTFKAMLLERRIEEIRHNSAVWYKFPNILDRIVTALGDVQDAELLVV
jgi:hypothetical protein